VEKAKVQQPIRIEIGRKEVATKPKERLLISWGGPERATKALVRAAKSGAGVCSRILEERKPTDKSLSNSGRLVDVEKDDRF